MLAVDLKCAYFEMEKHLNKLENICRLCSESLNIEEDDVGKNRFKIKSARERIHPVLDSYLFPDEKIHIHPQHMCSRFGFIFLSNIQGSVLDSLIF